jgi:NADP-dependent 3-hydroxy acid dehydrogenase YdfG
MQEVLCREEGKAHRAEMLLQGEDVASLVLQALTLPLAAEVRDISMRPMWKSSADYSVTVDGG